MFKDNIGMTEELKVEMVECGERVLEPAQFGTARTYLNYLGVSEIVWIDDDGKILKVQIVRYEA